jgi:DNA-binding transcriptional LysR family regulator
MKIESTRRSTPVDLAGEPLVVAPEGRPHRAMLQQLLRAAGCEPVIAVEATGWELALHFARLGIGIAVVNDFCPAPSGMVAVPLQGAPTITYYAMARAGLASPGTEVIRRLIAETLSAGS